MLAFLNFFIIPFILLIILILVHELGHFLAAKKSNVYVEEFGFGIPPRVFGIKWKETIYSINALPLGGFVRLFGEEGGKDPKGKISSDRAFYSQKTWSKILIITSGVLMNLILAIVVFSVSYSVTGIPEESNNVRIIEVASESPAEASGLQAGDLVLNLAIPGEETKIESLDNFSSFVEKHGGEEITVQIERSIENTETTETISFLITPRLEHPDTEGPTGVTISNVEEVFYPWWQMPFRGAWAGVQEAFAWMTVILVVLFQMLRALFTSGVAPEVGGPVEIFRIGGQVAQLGIIPTLRFMGILSVNLAVLNILPLPALDGGRLVFVIWEGITGKKVKPEVEHAIHNFGMALLIVLIVLVTFKDINRIFADNMLFTRIQEWLVN